MSHSVSRGGADPHGQYQFQTELVGPADDEPTRRRNGVFRQLIASRRYVTTRRIPALGPTNPRLTALIEQYTNTTVERGGETVDPPGVTISTIFEATSGSG